MNAYYTDQFVLSLPPGHRFPMQKYGRLRSRVASELRMVALRVPAAATDEELAHAHDASYIGRVANGELDSREQRAIGLPWSPQLVERSRRSAGATIAACRTALRDGVATNLAGGTHHASRARGAGFCVFNDAAVAARVLQSDHGDVVFRVAVVDLDVHQGDGTAEIFTDDSSVFTLSLHGQANFPVRKQPGDLDVGLPDRTGDAVYLSHLDMALAELERRFAPSLIIYLAGADTHEHDRLGRLALTIDGMRARDERVFAFAERLGVPIAVVMAGGYGRDIDVTVALHLQTIALAFASWQRRMACATAVGG